MSVIFVMPDGVRPDAFTTTNCPTLNSIRECGSSTFAARSVMPSITLPCHTSIFHSVPPTRHGITSNTFVPFARPLPGLVEVAKVGEKRVAFFYNGEQLRDLARPGNLLYSHFRNSAYDEDGDDESVAHASQFIQKENPDFLFLYIDTVDTAGHAYGWMSDQYLRQLERVDSLLTGFFDALPSDYTAIVHNDYGGHDRNRGTDSEEDMIILWIATGPNIRKGYTTQSQVSLLEAAPTIAKLLELKPHHDGEGKCVEEIFQ